MHTISAKTEGCILIDGQPIQVGDLRVKFNGNTVQVSDKMNANSFLISTTYDQITNPATGTAFVNMAALQTFIQANFFDNAANDTLLAAQSYADDKFNLVSQTANALKTTNPADTPSINTFNVSDGAGTYTFFLSAPSTPIVFDATADSMASKNWQLRKVGTYWQKYEIKLGDTSTFTQSGGSSKTMKAIDDQINAAGFDPYRYGAVIDASTQTSTSGFGNCMVQLDYTIPVAATATKFNVLVSATGTIVLLLLRNDGSGNFVEVSRTTQNVVSGLNSISINVAVLAGDKWGVITSSTVALKYSSGGTRHFAQTPSASPITLTAAAIATGLAAETYLLAYNVELSGQTPGLVAQLAAKANTSDLAAFAQSGGSAKTMKQIDTQLNAPASSVYQFGKSVTTAQNNVATGSNCMLQLGYSVPSDSAGTQLNIGVDIAGTVVLILLRSDGSGNFAEVNRQAITLGNPGINSVSINTPVLAGDYFAISNGTAKLKYASGTGLGSYVPVPSNRNPMYFSASELAAPQTGISLAYNVTIAAQSGGLSNQVAAKADAADLSALESIAVKDTDLGILKGTNLVNAANAIPDIGTNNTGSIGSHTGWAYIRVPVLPSTTYSIRNGANSYSAGNVGSLNYEDTTGSILSYVDMGTLPASASAVGKTFTTPVGCYFVGCNIKVLSSDFTASLQVQAGGTSSNYTPYVEFITKVNGRDIIALPPANIPTNYLYGKTLLAAGDSMVYGHTVGVNNAWPALIGARNNMSVINAGRNGNRLTNTGDTSEGGSQGISLVVRYTGFDTSADFVLIFISTNDAAAGVTMGADSSTDITEFKGALNVVCDGLITMYSTKKIGFITPYNRTSVYPAYCTAMQTICAKYGIKVFDNIAYGGVCWTNAAQVNALTLNDTYHLNVAGHQYVSYKYEDFLRSL